jgi:hypothetical protein
MSKIAEKKVRELGYGKDPLYRNEYSANDVFEAAVECYDQAMQDFLEKAEEWFDIMSPSLTKGFIKYMQDEM